MEDKEGAQQLRVCVCVRVFVAVGIPDLNVVRIIAVEIPELGSISNISRSIRLAIGLSNHSTTIVVEILTAGIFEVEGTGTTKLYKLTT